MRMQRTSSALLCTTFAATSLAFTTTSEAAVIALYDFNDSGNRTVSSDTEANSQAQNIAFGGATGESIVYNGSNQLLYSNSDYFGGTSAANRDDALAAGQYVGFVVDADSGFTLDLDAIQFDYNRGNSAPRRVAVYGATNGSSSFSFLGQASTSNASALQDYSIDLSSNATFQGLSSVEFRIVPFEDNTSRAALRLDNIEIIGDVTPIPEPASLVLLAAGGALLVSRRR